MTPGSIDPPCTGLLVSKQPVLGIAIRREDGTTLPASDRFVPGAVLNQGSEQRGSRGERALLAAGARMNWRSESDPQPTLS